MHHALRRSRPLVPLAAAAAAALTAGLLAAPAAPAARADAAPAPSAAQLAAARKADARIAAKLKVRLRHAALGKDVAIRVYDPVTRKTVFASQSNERQLPASNMKIVTAVNALAVMGPETRFPTRVVRGSTATSIVLVGGGDPLLSSSGLRALARRTVNALAAQSPTGVAPAKVRLSVDATLFPKPTRATGWPSWYGLGEISPVRALGRHGVRSSDTTVDARAYFVKRLDALGVKATFAGTVGKPAKGDELARVAGHTVEQAVRAMLPPSDNQVAEVLFRQTALHSGRTASWTGASKAARATLAELGVPTAKLSLRDGSGLSRSNRVTAAAMVAVIKRVTDGTHPELAPVLAALPVSGRTGTLSTRYASAPSKCARGKVKAKTGFVNGVVALSGTARAADGRPRVFSIVANHIPSKRHSVRSTQLAVDALAATITGCY